MTPMLYNIRRVVDQSEIAPLYPLVEEYSSRMDRGPDVDELFIELLRSLESNDQIVISASNFDGQLIGYAMGKYVNNYGDRCVFVVQIYSDLPGVGKDLFDHLIEWGVELGCGAMIGFVPEDQAEATSRLWKARPWRVMLRRDI